MTSHIFHISCTFWLRFASKRTENACGSRYCPPMSAKLKPSGQTGAVAAVDWRRVVALVQCSRAMDAIEETTLVPAKKIFYQFSARGHDMAQVLLGLHLTHTKDA